MIHRATIHPEMTLPEMTHQEMTRQVTCCSEHTGTTSSAVSLFNTPGRDSVNVRTGYLRVATVRPLICVEMGNRITSGCICELAQERPESPQRTRETHLGTDRQRRREPVAQYLDQQLPLGERI